MGRGAARLHRAGQLAVECREGDGDGDEAFLRHRREQIEIAQHQRGLGDQRDRMIVRGQHFENAARDAQLLLDRLVDVGVAGQHDEARLVGFLRQLAREQGGGRGLHEDLRLEIEARREAAIGVVGPGEAIDAAVFAALVGIDRAIERDVGRGVVGDDRLRLLDDGFRLQGFGLFLCRPTVIEGLGVLASRTGRRRWTARRVRAPDPAARTSRRRWIVFSSSRAGAWCHCGNQGPHTRTKQE